MMYSRSYYTLFALSLNLFISNISAMQCDNHFLWFVITQLGVIFDEAQSDNQNPEFYELVAASLQRKTVHELVLLSQISDKFVQNKPITQLPAVKQAVHALICKTLEQAVITPEDMLLFNKLEDTESLQYALQALQPLRAKAAGKQTFMCNKLMLMLHIRLEGLKKLQDKPPVILPTTKPTTNKSAPIKTCQGRPSDEWILLGAPAQPTNSQNQITDTLYKEVIGEMINTSILSPTRAPAHKNQHSTQEFTVTRASEIDNSTIIMHNYQASESHQSLLVTLPLTQALESIIQQWRNCQETLNIQNQQKKALEETCEQLRSTITHNAQLMLEHIDSAPQRLHVIEQERTRLLHEELEIFKEQEATKKRLEFINARIIQLNALEQNFKEKQKSQPKAPFTYVLRKS